jgi:hypothetical protein
MAFPVDPAVSLPATTTAQQDITTAGQRRVNLIWEFTQAAIAILIVVANVIVEVAGKDTKGSTVLSSAMFLVIGFYFSRTNHSAIGGIGSKPIQDYQGR